MVDGHFKRRIWYVAISDEIERTFHYISGCIKLNLYILMLIIRLFTVKFLR